MNYEKALEIAQKVQKEIEPYCERLQIAGSLRRKKQEAHDIELVAIPKDRFQLGLIVNKWKKIKGDVGGKYLQRELPEGINLDLFFATKENWGNILLIRTGNWQFSRQIMIKMLAMGLKQKDGYLWNNQKMVECREEENIFRILKLNFIPPEDRNNEVYTF